jgi:hypothetical protein
MWTYGYIPNFSEEHTAYIFSPESRSRVRLSEVELTMLFWVLTCVVSQVDNVEAIFLS